jgi:hypothetical protein
MEKQIINYETLVKITSAISATRDPEEVVLLTVESVKTVFNRSPDRRVENRRVLWTQ